MSKVRHDKSDDKLGARLGPPLKKYSKKQPPIPEGTKGATRTEKIRKLTLAGFSATEIAQSLNCTAAYVYKVRQGMAVDEPIAAAEGFKADKKREKTEKEEVGELTRMNIPQQKNYQNKVALIEALFESKGIVSYAIKACDLTYQTYYRWMREDETFARRVDEVKEAAIDFVEDKLFSQIEENNHVSTIFFLKTRGRNRGYSERVELAGPNDGPIEIRVIEPFVDALADNEVDSNVIEVEAEYAEQ